MSFPWGSRVEFVRDRATESSDWFVYRAPNEDGLPGPENDHQMWKVFRIAVAVLLTGFAGQLPVQAEGTDGAKDVPRLLRDLASDARQVRVEAEQALHEAGHRTPRRASSSRPDSEPERQGRRPTDPPRAGRKRRGLDRAELDPARRHKHARRSGPTRSPGSRETAFTFRPGRPANRSRSALRPYRSGRRASEPAGNWSMRSRAGFPICFPPSSSNRRSLRTGGDCSGRGTCEP